MEQAETKECLLAHDFPLCLGRHNGQISTSRQSDTQIVEKAFVRSDIMPAKKALNKEQRLELPPFQDQQGEPFQWHPPLMGSSASCPCSWRLPGASLPGPDWVRP